MTSRGVRVLAAAVWIAGAVGFGASVVLTFIDGRWDLTHATQEVGFLAVGLVGLIVARRQPRNPIGWLYLAAWAGVAFGSALGEQYASWGAARPGTVGAETAAWLANWAWVPIFGVMLPYPFLLFPDGRLPSPRWRWVAWAIGIVTVLWSIAFAFQGADYTDALGRHAPNPYAIESLTPVFDVGRIVLAFAFLGLTGACLVSLVMRFRRRRGDERQQIKWLLLSGALFIAYLATPIEHGEGGWIDALMGILVALIPISIGIAILKYRLYEIDLVIRKTFVYAVLAAFITIVYVAVVAGAGTLLGRGDRPNVALQIAATALVAVLFQPVRERATRLANRVVYGRRASPYETLTRFSDRVGGAYATEDVLARIARVIAEGIGAARVDVWLRVGEELRPAASWPEDVVGRDVVPLVGADLPRLEAQHSVAVRLGEDLLGAVSADKPASEPFTTSEQRLLEDLAGQAGLVLSNVRMTAELQANLQRIAAQAADLRASRQRIVAAQDQERRRLERNIHDGAQQHLVALAVKLRLARSTIARDPVKAREMLIELQREIDDALETLTSLALGIYPPLLEEQGLAPALAAQYTRSGLPVHLSSGGTKRYPLEVEGAVYFCVLEALQNAAKYAAASRIDVVLEEVDGALRFEVRDDGSGFDTAGNGGGTGLAGMRDRLSVFGGDATVDSVPGRGTTVRGWISVREEVPSGR